MFLESRLFRFWLIAAAVVWLILFRLFNDLDFFLGHWFYPATMVLGAFVAGATPEGGGAVAFPVLNIFLNVDRTLARDFALMIQSVGMTSASLFILTNPKTDRSAFRPLLWWLPIAFAGFVVGMHTLQGIEIHIIQALFLSLIASFTVVYLFSTHRGSAGRYAPKNLRDHLFTAFALFLGGMSTSLFGSGVDILTYTLLVTHFTMKEKLSTEMSVIMMAGLSLLAFAYRGLCQGSLTHYQIQTWLCAFPVVLIMAPLGAHVLRKIHTELMLRAIMVLNVAQLVYFNLHNPSRAKLYWSLGFTVLLSSIFFFGMAELARRKTLNLLDPIEAGSP